MGDFAQDHMVDGCRNLCKELLQSGREVGLDSQSSVGQREFRAKGRGAGHEGVGVKGHKVALKHQDEGRFEET